MKIPVSELAPLMSAYLSGGWRKDDLELEEVDYEPGKIVGTLRVLDYFRPSDGIFHFTVPLAFTWVAQLAIIATCLSHNLKEKPGEVYLREINIQCRRMINKTEDLRIALELVSRRYLPGGIYYIGNIDIDNGAFVGLGKYIVPLPLGVGKSTEGEFDKDG